MGLPLSKRGARHESSTHRMHSIHLDAPTGRSLQGKGRRPLYPQLPRLTDPMGTGEERHCPTRGHSCDPRLRSTALTASGAPAPTRPTTWHDTCAQG